MSDSLIKISDLNTLSKAQLDPTNDFIPIVDFSENETKSIKVEDIQESMGLPTSGDNLDFLVFSNRKIKITSATKVSTYVLDVTLLEPHDLVTGDTIKIYYEDAIQGFSAPIYGTFTITNIIPTVIRITSIYNLGAGSYTTAGYIEVIGQKEYNYFYDGNKSVELRYTNGKSKFFSSINSAVNEANASSGNVIVHRKTTPYDESILLKNNVSITLEEGAIVTCSTLNTPVFYDGWSDVNCKILGSGIIKQTSATTASGTAAILISGTNSEIVIECDYVEATGGTAYDGAYGKIVSGYTSCIRSSAKSTTIKANKIISKSGVGIYITDLATNFNIDVGEIETGIVPVDNNDPNKITGSTALITYGDGFVKANKIVCNNNGHAFSHRRGKCVAHIDKIYKTTNDLFVSAVSCLGTQSYNDVELTLFFDEIASYAGINYPSPTTIECGRGIMNLYGRRISCATEAAVVFTHSDTGPEGLPGTPTGIIEVDEIYSGNWYAVSIDANNTVPIIIKNTKIYANGYAGSPMGALSVGGQDEYNSNNSVILRNCHIQQLTNNITCHAIRVGNGTQTIILSGCEIETTHSSAYSIYSALESLVPKHRNILIRLPIWQNKNEDPYIHYITTGGIIIQ